MQNHITVYLFTCRIIASLLLFIMPFLLIAQIKPEFFPEEIHTEYDAVQCFCQPGVLYKRPSRGLSIIYGYMKSGGYEPEGTTQFLNTPSILNRQERIEFKLKVPIILKDRFRLLLGYKYYSEFYDLQLIGEDFKTAFQTLDMELLKNNEFSTILSYSLSEKNYLAVRYKYSLNGNYDGWIDMDSQYAIHSFMAIYGIKKADALEWGFGFFYNRSFRRTSFFPFLLYNRTFDFNWGIEALFPANIFLRYNVNTTMLASFGIEYGSKSFRLNNISTVVPLFDYAFNHSELLISLSLEKQLFSWIWGTIKFGYQKNFSNDFEDKTGNFPTFQAEPKNGVFFRVGVFVSPSKYW